MSETQSLSHQASVALRHGVDLNSVVVPSQRERLQILAEVLSRADVPFPIPQPVADRYFSLAQQNVPFGIGTLSDETVELDGFENTLDYDSLTHDDHLSWACLVADQQSTKHTYACQEYMRGEQLFEIGGNVIPDYYTLNARIFQQTGWQLATVSEIIPAHVFFHCHSRKFFPVTTFIRPFDTDYLEEPDIGHDIAGHVATFTIPQVAEVMNNHGLANDIIHREKNERIAAATSEAEIAQIRTDATELLLYAGRLYWFTVEFGLVSQADSGEPRDPAQPGSHLKAFGAGILSSPGETRFSIDSPDSNRVLIDPTKDLDLLRLATTDYLISEFQKTYFVLNDFQSLSSLTPDRIVNLVKTAQRLPHYTWRELAPIDRVINVGTCLTSPNEKYLGLLADQNIDPCLKRAAIRNLRILSRGIEPQSTLEKTFFQTMPPIPQEIIETFAIRDQQGLYADAESETTGPEPLVT